MAAYLNETNTVDKGKELVRQAEKCFSRPERTNIESLWALLAEFILPSQYGGFYQDTSKGVRRDLRRFESTAVTSSRDLANAMHSTVTNPTLRWSDLVFKDEKLNDNTEALQWLDRVAKEVHDAIQHSNFHEQVGQGYRSFNALGTMILFQEEKEDLTGETAFHFDAWHLSEIAYSENVEGIVDCIYRRTYMTYRQLYERWADKLDESMVEKYQKNPDEEECVYICIGPRPKNEIETSDIGLLPPHKRPFYVYYVLKRNFTILEEGGYYEFPVFVTRWSLLPNEIYGHGPGHEAIADVRTVNKVVEEALKALAKANNPSIIAQQNNVIKADLRPGKITTVRDMNQFREFVTQSRFDVVKLELEELRTSIKSAFYIDKLLLPPRTETGEMTAYEIAQRLEQMQQILGPVLSRLNSEFLNPLITRSLNILWRSGKLPPIPDSVLSLLPVSDRDRTKTTLEFDVKFVNSLSRAQQLDELRNMQTWFQEIALIAQLRPEILDNLNTDEIFLRMSRIRNIPEQLLLTKDQVTAIRKQKEQAQAEAQMLSSGEQLSNIAGNLMGGSSE